MSGNRLNGRTALITGASRGIGAAVAKAFAAQGAHVLVLSRSGEKLEELAADIRGRGGRADVIACDLSDEEAFITLAAMVVEVAGKLDILVANAAMLGPMAPLAQTSEAEWLDVFDINLHANFRLIRALDPLLQASDAGRAIFVSSGAAQSCKAGWGAYAASKAALEALAKTYANETAGTALRANILDPGSVRTDMRAAAYPQEDPLTHPAPEEITGIFIDLASPACTRHGEVVSAM